MPIGFELIRGWPGLFGTAWRFLTIIPIGTDGETTPERMGRSMSMFPAVGLALGGVLLSLHLLGERFFPRALEDVLLIAVLIGMTGAFHLDGFADLCDGLAGGRDRKTTLSIMRDSRIGAVGVVGVMMLLLIKVTALIESPGQFKPALLLCMPAVGRLAMLQQAAFFPYAREGEGTGKAFADYAGWSEYNIGLLITAVPLLLLLGPRGILILFILTGVTWWTGRDLRKRLGGVTGDTQGFAGELSEALFLIFAVLFF